MDIHSKHGVKVIYTGTNGYEIDRECANSTGLIVGKEYTIDSINIYNYTSDVFLIEFPDKRFNTVMFENVI